MTPSVFPDRRHWVRIFFSAAAVGFLSLAGRNVTASELFSESVYVPPTTELNSYAYGTPDLQQVWKRFHILLSGDPTLPAQNSSDPNTDPFAVNGTSTITTTNPYVFPAGATGDWIGPGPIQIGGLTAVNFAGTVAINAANIPNQNISNPSGQVQFGLTGPINNKPLQIVGQNWGYEPVGLSADEPFLRSIPVVGVTPSVVAPATPPPGSSFQYIVNFLQFQQDGISGTEWVEFPYLAGQQPTFTYGGWADQADAIHFTSNEIQLSNTQIPLDDLNFADDPLAGGTLGSAFISEALPADVVPEPSQIMLLGLGAVGLLMRWRMPRVMGKC